MTLLIILGLSHAYAPSAYPHQAIGVVQDKGVWWFQDDAGRRFFSLGVNCIGSCYGHAGETPISPPRKQRVIALLKAWGFNTAGSWSSPSAWDELYFADQIYAKFFEIQDDIFDEAFWTEGFTDHLQREMPLFLNVGLLSHGEGSVYEELTHWAACTNAAVQAMHQAAYWEPPPTPAPQRLILQRFTPTVDGDLAEWPQELAIRPTPHRQPLVYGELAAHTYFLAWDGDALFIAGDIADSHLQHPGPERWWQADFLAIELRPVELVEPHTSEPSVIFLFPTGGGSDLHQPYVALQEGPRQLRLLATEVAKRPKPGGYTIEAHLPAAAIAWPNGTLGTSSWHVTLMYQNVNEISQTRWHGNVTLQ